MENKEKIAVEETVAEEFAENTVNETAAAEAPEAAAKPGFKAKVKEWFRKQIVSLKRKPQKIAFLFFIISALISLLGLSTTSQGPVSDFQSQPYLGLSVFIVVLFSILVLVLFMNTFPKRGVKYKKDGKRHSVNYIMLALTFVFLILMFLFDLLYYTQLTGCIKGNEVKFFSNLAQAQKYEQYWSDAYKANPVFSAGDYKSYLISALNLTIVHMVFLGISALLLATLPLYKKLIMKINTSKVVESTEIKEVIDTED